jgi:hypothetical protein
MIEIKEEHEEIFSISINDEKLQSDDGEIWHLPKGLVGDTSVEEMPVNVVFEVCSRIENSMIFIDSVPFSIRKKNNTTVQVKFNDSGTRKYWDGTIGFKPYMEAKKAIVEERAKEVGKFGNIPGAADGEIDQIIGQVDDAFKMPFYDLYTKQKQRISKLAIIISGKFTENAIEKICEKIESHGVRNNLTFIDGDKIQTLAEQFKLKA